ncbi:MAG: cytochrome c biogenesis protein CcsA [Gammaproteobacteria bacterium]|nr:cytochrome c biogenesis protein CcsA [Gammaproteobacteria bacterium]
MTQIIIGFFAIVLYALTGLLLARRLFHDRTKTYSDGPFTKPRIIAIGLFAVLLHAIVLYHTLFVPAGLNIGFFNALSLIGWLIALLLLLAALSNPVESLGVFLLPLVGIAVALEMLFPGDHTLDIAQALELKLHIMLSVLAYSLLSIAAVQAILLAIQDSHLRNKRPGGFIRTLPPLQTMEALLFQMIGLGLALLSLSLLSGSLYLDDMFAQHLVHKTILSIIAWVVFATLLWGRWRFGWRGRTAIRWTLSGFFVLLLAYIGSKLITELVLGR